MEYQKKLVRSGKSLSLTVEYTGISEKCRESLRAELMVCEIRLVFSLKGQLSGQGHA